jgi:hypothetical protein
MEILCPCVFTSSSRADKEPIDVGAIKVTHFDADRSKALEQFNLERTAQSNLESVSTNERLWAFKNYSLANGFYKKSKALLLY